MDFNKGTGFVQESWSFLVSTRIPQSDVMGFSKPRCEPVPGDAKVGLNHSILGAMFQANRMRENRVDPWKDRSVPKQNQSH